MTRRRLFPVSCACIMTLALVLVFASCSDDDPAQPETPATPTFTNIWPASPGNYWAYQLTNHHYETGLGLYDTPEETPLVPDMDTLYASLGEIPELPPAETSRGNFRLEFSEDVSTEPGTVKMSMVTSTENLEGTPTPPSPLWLGIDWVHSGDRISTLVGSFMGWLHLDSDLTPGHEFSAELPSMVETHLNSRVERIRTCEVADRSYENCLEVFYVLDMGIQTVINEHGQVLGYYHPYGFGFVVYAPEIGPIVCREKIMLGPEFWHDRYAEMREHGGTGL